MKSHDLATQLRQTADYLLSHPDFELAYEPSLYLGNYYSDKDKFIAAVRALGSGKKTWDREEMQFEVNAPLTLYVRVLRATICRKVQDEKWECEPLLTSEDEASIGFGSGLNFGVKSTTGGQTIDT